MSGNAMVSLSSLQSSGAQCQSGHDLLGDGSVLKHVQDRKPPTDSGRQRASTKPISNVSSLSRCTLCISVPVLKSEFRCTTLQYAAAFDRKRGMVRLQHGAMKRPSTSSLQSFARALQSQAGFAASSLSSNLALPRHGHEMP